MRSILIFCYVFIVAVLNGQKEDLIWLTGSTLADNFDPTLILDSTAGATNIDFNYNPVKIYYDSSRLVDVYQTCSSVCDSTGKLLAFTNGMAIYGKEDFYIEDTINFNDFWQTRIYYQDGSYIEVGINTIQAALMLPLGDSIFTIYQQYQAGENITDKVLYASFTSIGDNSFSPVNKDQLIITDSLGTGRMNAVRHANGRDWWLIFPELRRNIYYVTLLTPDGFSEPVKQIVDGSEETYGIGQLYFSPDGSKIAVNSFHTLNQPDGGHISIMDFDRCTGLIGDAVHDEIASFGLSFGVSFSPSGRFVYASNGLNMYQYDTQAADVIGSRQVVAEYDGYLYYYPEDTAQTFGWPTYLAHMGLAPDGKIYITAGSGSNRKMSVIHYPDQLGPACFVDQHAVHITTNYKSTMPNFPNFRLGPLDGSSCDTLGLDNYPVAKFRCDQDTSDAFHIFFNDLSYYNPADWSWTIDGQSFEDQHIDYTFSEGGSYEVCLTVSNEYGTDAYCKTIKIGMVSSTKEEINTKVDLHLFPNPVVDQTTLSFHDYFPIDAMLHVHDATGRLRLSRSLDSNWNNLSLSGLEAGVYFLQVYDQGVLLDVMKMVKR